MTTKTKKNEQKEPWKELLIDLMILVVLFFLIRIFIFAPFRVNGISMCDNFNVYDDVCRSGAGELILTSRFPTWSLFGASIGHIQRGDVVVIKNPNDVDGDALIKRVIGLPGDRIKIEEGYVYLELESGGYEQLDETYLNEENLGHTTTQSGETEFFNVPENSYFVMGDNRTKSSDSRRCFGHLSCREGASPFVSEDLLQGEVKLVLLPFSHIRLVKEVDYNSSVVLK